MTRSQLLAILLLAISSNGDNVGVGVAYGMRRIDVPLSSNLLIAIATGLGTLAAMLAGQSIGNVMDPHLSSALGGAIIVALGVWVLLQAARSAAAHSTVTTHVDAGPANQVRSFTRFMRLLDDPVIADRDMSRSIDPRESWLLAAALSLNNVVNGVAAGMVRLSPVFTALCVMAFSVVTLKAGLVAGFYCGKRWLSSFAGAVSGMLLVALGLWEFRW